jgi:hypothetical protein
VFRETNETRRHTELIVALMGLYAAVLPILHTPRPDSARFHNLVLNVAMLVLNVAMNEATG